MKKKYLLLAIGFICAINFAQAQKHKTQLENNTFEYKVNSIFNKSAFGIEVGFHYPLNTYEISKTKKSGKEKKYIKSKYINLQLGYLRFDPSKMNLHLISDFCLNKKHKNNFFHNYSLGLGVARSFTYDKNYISASNIEEYNSLAGKWYLTPSLGLGFGYELEVGKKAAYSPFINFKFRPLIPYYRFLFPLAYLQVGVSIRL
jgi:hypothetical protein